MQRIVIAAVAAASALTLVGCTSPQPTVATFEVAGGPQTYKIELATPELIQQVKYLMAVPIELTGPGAD